MSLMTRRLRPALSFVLAACLLVLMAPASALAKKGEKNYNRGLQHEKMQQWEKAAQEYALAVASNPSDTEYQLHYQRALFNASQLYMRKGRALAEQGDFTGAYNAFRQAYGYDPVNMLAASEMGRMLRFQREKQGLPPEPESARGASAIIGGGARNGAAVAPAAELTPARPEQLTVVNYSGKLEPLVRNLARELNLNVVFDRDFAQQSGQREVTYNLRDVTTARALDYIFASQNLFFQKLDRRTILVADQSKRPQYQELVLRTFYLANITTDEARNLITQALPPNAGRQATVIANKMTNSITVRDTPENVRLIAELLPNVDKDRSEVVMDVSIYEVSRTDLLQLGNQLGSGDSLTNLGGLSVTSFGGRALTLPGAAAAIPTVTSAAILLPGSAISALQRKDNTKLVFSTQVHAYDAEKSETRIGQRVPVQTASVTPFGFGVGNNPGTGTGAPTNPGVFSGGFPVIQYEDTGLSLDFTPKVYPNQDVEVKMVIDTKDAVFSGSNNLTPTFTQRRVTGTARVPNNRTIMLASIAQDRQTNGREGLPLLGLIPVIGRLFSTPRRNNVESDVVITLTPRVLRAPSVGPADEETRPTGSLQTPRSESLEAMLRVADREDQLAAARRLPTNVTAQLPPAPLPVAASNSVAPQTTPQQQPASAAAANAAVTQANGAVEPVTFVPAPSILTDTTRPVVGNNGAAPAGAGALNASLPAAVNAPAAIPATINVGGSGTTTTAPADALGAELRLGAEPGAVGLRAGARQRLLLTLKADAPLALAAATLRFDGRLLAVRSIAPLAASAASAATTPLVTYTVDQAQGVLVVSIMPKAGSPPLAGEVTLVVEVEGLAAGEVSLGFDESLVHFVAANGRPVATRPSAGARLKVLP